MSTHALPDGTRGRGFGRTVARVSVALALVASLVNGAILAQRLDPRLEGSALRPVVLEIAAYTSHRDLASEYLSELGFTPPDSERWRAFPAVRKIEFAYLAAEEAQAGSGERLLRRLADAVRRDYPGAAYHHALRALPSPPDAGSIRFARLLPAPSPQWRPDPGVQRTILAVAHYAEGAGLGGPQGVLQHYFELPEERVYDILRSSGTTAEAIERGLAWVPEAERHPRLQRLARDVVETYPAAARNRTIVTAASGARTPERLLANASGPGPAVSTDSGGAGGGDSAAADARARHAANYRQFVNRHYAQPAARAFRTVARGARGFGGVVVGNSVDAAPALAPLKAVAWVQAQGAASGMLEFHFESGPPRVVTGVAADHMLAAWRLVTGIDGVPAPVPGEAIGLLGIGDMARVTDCRAGELVRRPTWRVTVHPALADLPIGHDVLAVDLLPTEETQDRLIASIEARQGPEAALAIQRLFIDNALVTWKFVDEPIRIEPEGSRLIVRRAADANFEPRLRERALFTLNGFADPELDPLPGLSDAFYRHVPALTEAVGEYDRFNRFIAVLALVRWAKAEGANFVGHVVAQPNSPLPAIALVDATGYEALDVTDDDGIGIRQRALFERRVAESNIPRSAIDAYDRLMSAQADALTIALEAEARLDGSDEEWELFQVQRLAPAARQQYARLMEQFDAAIDRYLGATAGSAQEADAEREMDAAERALQNFRASAFGEALRIEERRIAAADAEIARTESQLEQLSGRHAGLDCLMALAQEP